VLLVDDHALFRSGVKSLLSKQAGFEGVGEGRSEPRGAGPLGVLQGIAGRASEAGGRLQRRFA
jgi:DNA-binding NarL/FixJ family response regulator